VAGKKGSDPAPGTAVSPLLKEAVVVRWVDANSQREQNTEKEALAVPLPIVKTYGLLLEDSPTRVVVVGEELAELVDGEWQFTYRNTTVVPRGMVLTVTSIKEER
jgi:hypothetical protein